MKSLGSASTRCSGTTSRLLDPTSTSSSDDYQRRQTMANAERFITPELKEYEAKVLGAEERILALEQRPVRPNSASQVAAEAGRVQRAAEVVAQADVLACFAEVAARNRLRAARRSLTVIEIEIRGGRHPVVELTLQRRALRAERHPPELRRGPGAYHHRPQHGRQVHLPAPGGADRADGADGSFVPADSAAIGVVDRIFTRVGASDDLATGQSTFMVEMTETANILHHATRRSLIVLDEIGRGTSTFDGLSIAWSVAEHIHNAKHLGAKTLFATHYHHLNELAEHAAAGEELPHRREGEGRSGDLPPPDRARRDGPQLRHPGGPAGRPADRKCWSARSRFSGRWSSAITSAR